INMAYPLPLDTAYRSSGTEVEILKELQKVMAELILNENMKKAQYESNLSITSNAIKIDLNNEFLVELQKNMYHRTHYEDVVDHNAKISDGDEKITLGRNLLRNSSIDSISNHMMEKMKCWTKERTRGLIPVELDVMTQKVIFQKVDVMTQKVIFQKVDVMTQT
ncbi:hypothetical protein Tco_1280488, partial [Tanacetum coccineum]